MSTWYCSYGVANCPTCVRPTQPMRAEAVAPVSTTMPRSQAFLDLRATMARPNRPADPIVTRRAAAVRVTLPTPVERYTPPLAPPVERTAPVARESIRFLSVPYREKDQAKSLGARWHKFSKRWYVPAGMERAPFARWMEGAERLDVAPVAAVAPPPAPTVTEPVAAPVPVAAWPTRQAPAAPTPPPAPIMPPPPVTYTQDEYAAALAEARRLLGFKPTPSPKPEAVTLTVTQAAEKARHA